MADFDIAEKSEGVFEVDWSGKKRKIHMTIYANKERSWVENPAKWLETLVDQLEEHFRLWEEVDA